MDAKIDFLWLCMSMSIIITSFCRCDKEEDNSGDELLNPPRHGKIHNNESSNGNLNRNKAYHDQKLRLNRRRDKTTLLDRKHATALKNSTKNATKLW